MKIAHLILAHTAPDQLARLISVLDGGNASFFVHLDQKADKKAFDFLLKNNRVKLVTRRVKVAWGAYSVVQATINGFREILHSGIEPDYVNLLSGADYPLKSPQEITAFFEANRGKSFVHYELVMEQWKEAIPRLTQYHLTDFGFPGKYFFQKWINRLLPQRKMPHGLIPVGRSQWMTLTLEAVRYILDYLDSHAELSSYFKLTWAPEELIFQTILYNSPLKASVVNDNLRYIDWTKGAASPRTLAEEDLDKLMRAQALFARKFDMGKYPNVLDKLDKRVQSHRNGISPH